MDQLAPPGQAIRNLSPCLNKALTGLFYWHLKYNPISIHLKTMSISFTADGLYKEGLVGVIRNGCEFKSPGHSQPTAWL